MSAASNAGKDENMNKAFIVRSGMLTPYGRGTASAWEGLMSGRDALSPIDRFDISAMRARNAGLIKGLAYHSGSSLVLQMCEELMKGMALPQGTRLFLATTKGEIDLLEQDLLQGNDEAASRSNPVNLLRKLEEMLKLPTGGMVVSAACASSTSALAMAASEVANNRAPSALVVGCDSVTEFVYSGFSSLMALDTGRARPFDASRAGLSVGEGAAYALVVGQDSLGEYNDCEERPIALEGWGMSSDANHMTGPSRDGYGLSRAIEAALKMAGMEADDMGSISAHGTGTVYNDSMELKAFNNVFARRPRPTYSVKGGMGHSMGAAGLVEALIAGYSIHEGKVPPTVGLREVDQEAAGWASPDVQATPGARYALTTNSGFGGINAALIVGAPD